ncbi:hypothetical protein DMA12_26440 [Amycolatopsis balhimycina DSM 5908]|uniref:VCBS repeat-containing protein n=1 Tax=Amycolatopsis balhimycina DSM 5908 TaxID=1081091 RepID=A0A428WCD0_AMYBA|nr:hypothetical protein [Amycolatopsis balhimycina]RSM40758.1 hypothetical protein DMA12_26440 [Amycolatopsis balhimycina DSM 5908]
MPGPTATAPEALGPAPDDLRKVDWANATLPAQFCSIQEPVHLQNGESEAMSAQWGRVHVALSSVHRVMAYGDLDGDGRPEAAVGLECDNNGGTASGQLAFGYAVIGTANGSLRALGSIGTRKNPEDAGHATLTGGASIARGTVVVEELWYRHADSTCCPSGTARTTWRWQDGELVPGSTVVTS